MHELSVATEPRWKAPRLAYERTPTAPPKLSAAERREAIREWIELGLLDERGRPAPRWQGALDALFGGQRPAKVGAPNLCRALYGSVRQIVELGAAG